MGLIAIITIIIIVVAVAGSADQNNKNTEYYRRQGKGENRAREYYLACLMYAEEKPKMDIAIGSDPTPQEEEDYIYNHYHTPKFQVETLKKYCAGQARKKVTEEGYIPSCCPYRLESYEGYNFYSGWGGVKGAYDHIREVPVEKTIWRMSGGKDNYMQIARGKEQ